MVTLHSCLHTDKGKIMFGRTPGNGYAPFVAAQQKNDNEEKEAKTAQMPYKPMQQAPKMPQTPYAYAQKANAPEANRPTYAGAPMMANNEE